MPQMLANLLQMPAWELDRKQKSESAVLPNLTRHKSLQISNKYFQQVFSTFVFQPVYDVWDKTGTETVSTVV